MTDSLHIRLPVLRLGRSILRSSHPSGLPSCRRPPWLPRRSTCRFPAKLWSRALAMLLQAPLHGLYLRQLLCLRRHVTLHGSGRAFQGHPRTAPQRAQSPGRRRRRLQALPVQMLVAVHGLGSPLLQGLSRPMAPSPGLVAHRFEPRHVRMVAPMGHQLPGASPQLRKLHFRSPAPSPHQEADRGTASQRWGRRRCRCSSSRRHVLLPQRDRRQGQWHCQCGGP